MIWKSNTYEREDVNRGKVKKWCYLSPTKEGEAMDETIAKTLKGLKKRGLKGWLAENKEEAQKTILDLVPLDATLGLGDSSTVRQIGIIERLQAKGVRVINPFDPKKDNSTVEANFENTFWPMIEATVCDVFMAGMNALTEDGKIVNIDGVGNRVAGMIWGHPMTILVVGRNKIVKDLETALERIKDVIAPEHISRKIGEGGRGKGPPCTSSRECFECSGEKRVCAVTTIIEHKPLFTDIHVVIVDQDLGLGWDSSWPQERISAIADYHMKFVCPLPPKGGDKSTINGLLNMAKSKQRGK